MTVHHISTAHLTIDHVEEILTHHYQLALSDECREKVQRCRDFLDAKVEHPTRPIYGVTTGFGSLCNITISPSQLSDLQRNLVMSHACSLGQELREEIVRLMLLCKIQNLSYGASGAQVSTIQRLIDMYNADILPVVYDQGSLGASGDLAPLANMCLPLLGLGEVYYQGRRRASAEVLEIMGWKPITLKSKEGLALLNGTQNMLAQGLWCVMRARHLSQMADKVGALSLDAYRGLIAPFDARIQAIRPHPGQIATAAHMRSLLQGSEIITQPKEYVQDPYSFRCIPQVHGAAKDTLAYVCNVLEIELNSVTDNPTVFPDSDEVISAGNFHGEPIALPMDFLAVALSELCNISERRVYRLISGTRGLPSFLVAKPGLNSGFMIPQYAAASIVSQNKGLCWPASCDSIPSSQDQEDHVSMGANSASKLVRIVDNLERVLGIELLNAAQALEFRRPLKSSPALEDMVARLRQTVPFVEVDQVMYPLINAATAFVRAEKC